MGWASGSSLAEDVWLAIRKHIPKDKRQKVALEIVDLFEGHDCDTICEAESLSKAAGLYSEDEQT